jgi:SAM-dependent methyltransferase
VPKAEKRRVAEHPPVLDKPAAVRWRDALDEWAIPPDILEQADESPWFFPVEAFSEREDEPETPTHRHALEALPFGGRVIDVGAGGGAISRPLRARGAHIVGIDSQASMLEALDADEKVLGRWPDVASGLGRADVVVCGHVLYNVPDLIPFLRALDDAAWHRVVVEITDGHPLAVSAWLWRRFWGIERPSGPSADDALAVMRDMAIEPSVERWQSDSGILSFASLDDLVEFHRRRLCLPRSRKEELRELVAEKGTERYGRWLVSDHPRQLVTIWWDPAPRPAGGSLEHGD